MSSLPRSHPFTFSSSPPNETLWRIPSGEDCFSCRQNHNQPCFEFFMQCGDNPNRHKVGDYLKCIPNTKFNLFPHTFSFFTNVWQKGSPISFPLLQHMSVIFILPVYRESRNYYWLLCKVLAVTALRVSKYENMLFFVSNSHLDALNSFIFLISILSTVLS